MPDSKPPSCSWCSKPIFEDAVFIETRQFHRACARAVLLASRPEGLSEERVREIVRDEMAKAKHFY